MNRQWFQLTVEETLETLGTRRSGLTESEAGARLLEYGSNELQRRKKPPAILAFLRQFLSPLIYVLLVAAGISLAVQHFIDAGVILGVLLLNAAIGYVQETRAEKAMAALLEMAAPKAKVRREGKLQVVPAHDIVPGDLIVLEAGDKVPADARLIEAVNLKMNEAILTGESVATEKHTGALRGEAPLAERRNLVHMGTTVSYGRAAAAVVATGMSTEIGRIARAIEEVQPQKTPLQKSIASVSRFLVVLFLSLCALLILVGVLKGLGGLDIFLVAVAAAVSAIPEGLPAVVTVVLALGMRTMASRNAIVRKLVAVETLGSATVICTDKTGTLTKNEMTVRRIVVDGRAIEVSGDGYEPVGEFRRDGQVIRPKDDASLMLLLRIGALCNDALLSTGDRGSSILGDPTEGALVVVAAKAELDKEALGKAFPRLDEIPFQSEKQYMATMHPLDGRRVAYVKGAPERLLSMSKALLKDGQTVPLSESDARQMQEANLRMAAEAMRVIAFGYLELPPDISEVEDADLRGNLVLVGMAGMDDPPRQEAIKAVALCRQAHVRVVMATGDNRATAEAVGRQLGLPPGRSVTGSELAAMGDEDLASQITDISIFARVEPLHKLRIVNALKSRGEVVAMTGDGVNDAPALKAANIGIAMGLKGTDVAKEASDMVLADDNFASIVAAIEEGRTIFNRLRGVLLYLLSTSTGELFALLFSIVFTGQAPLLAVQIIWTNLATDTAVGVPLGLEPRTGDELKQPPRHPRVGLLYPGLLMRVAFFAAIMSAGVFAVFNWSYHRMSLDEARTMAFCTMVAFEWFKALTARSDEQSVFKIGLLRNRYLIAAIAAAALLQLAVVYAPPLQVAFHTVPLDAGQWGVIIGVGASFFAIEELRKVVAPRLFSWGKWAPVSIKKHPVS